MTQSKLHTHQNCRSRSQRSNMGRTEGSPFHNSLSFISLFPAELYPYPFILSSFSSFPKKYLRITEIISFPFYKIYV